MSSNSQLISEEAPHVKYLTKWGVGDNVWTRDLYFDNMLNH